MPEQVTLRQERVATHWMHPALSLREGVDARGRRVVCDAALVEGTLLVVWGGRIVDGATLALLPPELRTHALQVDTDHYQLPADPFEPADYINHSCEPSAGIRGQVTLVARRDLAVGDEVTFDYATTDSRPYDEFDCTCGAAACRGRVTGDDWRLPAVRARHRGWFSAYLARTIHGGGPTG